MTAISLGAAESALNVLTGNFALSVGTNPPTFTPGLYWWNTSVSQLYGWNGSGWYSLAQRYLTLLYANPATSGAGGTPAVLISDLVECTDTGYSRQLTTFGVAAPVTTGLPVQSTNQSAVTFSFPNGMTNYASWVALVTCPSGVNGLLLATWDVPSGMTQNVGPGQSITYPANSVVLDQA